MSENMNSLSNFIIKFCN